MSKNYFYLYSLSQRHCINNHKTVPSAIEKANKLLEKLFDSPIPSIYQIIGKKLLSLSSIKIPKAGFDLEEGELDSIDIGGGEITFEQVKSSHSLQQHLSENIENLIDYLEKSLENIKDKSLRVFICFDRVDEAWELIKKYRFFAKVKFHFLL